MTVSPLDSPVTGNLFGTPEMRAVFSDPNRLQRMLDVEAALARAQAALGLIPQEAAETIGTNAQFDIVDMETLRQSTERVGLPVVGLVAALVKACGKDAGRYVHWGATTQDIIDTGLVLQMRDGLDLLEQDLAALAEALAGLCANHRKSVMAGRTHLQHAVPVTFGYKAAVWLAGVLDVHAQMREARARVLAVQFGGAAGTLSALGDNGVAVMEGLAGELGLAAPDIPWHARRGRMAETAAVLAQLCGALGKIAKDVILLMQTEVAEVSEAGGEGRGGSSTMPQKRNPVASEYVLACARNVHAQLPVLMGAMVHDHERATDNWQAEWMVLPQMFVESAGALAHARALVSGLVVDSGRMRDNLELTHGMIMAESVQTALRARLGHEQAHHLVEQACRASARDGTGLRAALEAMPEIAEQLSGDEIRRALDPASYIGASDAFIDRVLARHRDQNNRGGE